MSNPRSKWGFRSTPSATNGNLPTLASQQQSKKEIANNDYWEQSKGKGRQAERLWGLENFGNTCYCNSVLQALFACDTFRQCVLSYPDVMDPFTPLGGPPAEISIGALSPPLNTGSSSRPSSPIASKTNPFDNPILNPTSPSLPQTKEKRGWGGLGGRRPSSGIFANSANVGGTNNANGNNQAPTPGNVQNQQPPKQMLSTLGPDIDMPDRTVFSTIQTLFQHLATSEPHHPVAPTVVQPASTQNGVINTNTTTLANVNSPPSASLIATSNNGQPGVPPGPPLLASLPPPSAPRGGGQFSAGSLGRGVVRPEDVLRIIQKENEMFRGMSQQDAHEFLGWLLNRIAEEVAEIDRDLKAKDKAVTDIQERGKTFVQNLFEGVLTNETRCLSCETTSSRDESFLDLSIDIEQHSSVTACLRQFSFSEMLCQKNKFYCEPCCGLQEAEKRMKIKKLPQVLALHLKRFKYQETLGRHVKLFYRVSFPFELRIPNTSEETEDADRLYELFAVVVHIGNGPHHGHYVALVRSKGRWVMCDDENVEPVDESEIYRYFGDYPTGAGYVLFYQAVGLDAKTVGLKNLPPIETEMTVEIPVNKMNGTDGANRTNGVSIHGMNGSTNGAASARGFSSMTTPILEEPTKKRRDPPAVPVSAPPVSTINNQSSASPVAIRTDSGETVTPENSKKSSGTTFSGLGVTVNSSMIGSHPETVQGVPISVPAPQPSASLTTPTASLTTPTRNQVSPAAVARPVPQAQAQQDDDKDRVAPLRGDRSPTTMSSSMISSISAISGGSMSTSSSTGANLASSLTSPTASSPKDFKTVPRDRTVSTSSNASSQGPADVGGGSGNGSKLGRRLSGIGGMGSKLTRSGSSAFGKMGFGRKDKD